MKTEFKASMKMFAFLMAVIMLIASLPVYAFAGLVEKEEEQAEELTETAADVIVLEEDILYDITWVYNEFWETFTHLNSVFT